jgi:hypothetical protein
MTQEYGKRQVSMMHEPLFLSQIWRSERKEAHDHRPLDRPGPVGAGICLKERKTEKLSPRSCSTRISRHVPRGEYERKKET